MMTGACRGAVYDTVILFITSEGEFSGATSTGETYVPRTTSAVVSLSSHLRFSS